MLAQAQIQSFFVQLMLMWKVRQKGMKIRVIPSTSHLEVVYHHLSPICPLALVLAGLCVRGILERYRVSVSSANDHGGGRYGTFDLLPNEEFLQRRSRDTFWIKVWQQHPAVLESHSL